MDQSEIQDLIRRQREFFAAGKTRDISFRLEQLKKLRTMITENEGAIFDALKRDLNKPAWEAYAGDTAIVVNELDYAVKHLRSWAKPKRVKTPLAYFPGSSHIHPAPYGVALIIGPWNFPVQLTLAPLVGAVAAGNCAVLKPSEVSPHTSRLLARLINKNFDDAFFAVVEGGADIARALLAEKFDCIFFTGSVGVGKLVMEAAAKHLTPVTLELGGKNPCIVDADIHLDYAARRITWGKFFNAGQSCVAPDYLLVDKRIKRELLEHINRTIREFYGADPSKSPDYARIVNDRHFDRIANLLKYGKIILGGKTDREARYIVPTILDSVVPDSLVMQEEIFGPVLPVIKYEDLSRAITIVNERPKSLALYIFSRNRKFQERALRETSSGGGCINDTTIHETTPYLPRRRRQSGIGKYHGKASFDAFSHLRSIIKQGFLFDIKLRYPPTKAS